MVAVPVADEVPAPIIVLAHLAGTRLTRRAQAFQQMCVTGAAQDSSG